MKLVGKKSRSLKLMKVGLHIYPPEHEKEIIEALLKGKF